MRDRADRIGGFFRLSTRSVMAPRRIEEDEDDDEDEEVKRGLWGMDQEGTMGFFTKEALVAVNEVVGDKDADE